MQSQSSLAPPTGRIHPSTNGREEEIPTDDGSAEEAEFSWEEYMEEAGASAAPHTAFKHVETSLRSSFQPGMKLEVAPRGGAQAYWVATIVTTCGPLLLLRYCGYGADRKADFWCDVMTAELHPVGWCTAHGKTLAPPPVIQERFSDWTDFLVQELTGARTAPANLLEGPMRGRNAVDLVVEGSLMEVRDSSSPALYWPARVIRNVGGRLCLRYAGLGGGGGGGAGAGGGEDFWLFYLDSRLRPLGWATEKSLSLEPPSELSSLRSAPHWQEALRSAQQEAQAKPLPLEVFKDQADLPTHGFSTGMKMEMVSPQKPLCICPASVTKVFDEKYFQVTVDDLSPGATPPSVLCWAGSPGLLPVQWSVKQGVGVARPDGLEGPDFDWAHYLKHSGAPAAPHSCFPDEWQSRGFSRDTCLEAVNPLVPSEVCVAKITQVKGRLMWLRLEGVSQVQSEFIVDVESMDIFPVGWCEANGYTLTTSHKPVCQKQKKIAVVQPEKQLAPPPPTETAPANTCSSPSLDPASASGRYCCSKIFINHRCFSGPYLNKGRIADLPQAVGPGRCSLVLKEVLTLLTNAAYKPGRVLKELQEVQEQSWECHEEVLKAKYKGKPYRATMRVVRLAEQVPAFCRSVCLRLQCCPNLFSPALVTGACPENCSTHTKTKYTYYYGKRRRLARPAGDDPVEADPSKPAQRRRRKRKAIFVQRKRRSSAADHTPASSLQDSDEDEDEEDEEDMDFQSGSDESAAPPATGPAPRTRPPRPRRAASLRLAAVEGGPGGRRRSARSHNNNNNNNNNNDEEEEEEEEKPAAQETMKEQEEALVLDRNPLEWSVEEVVQFITSTDCSSLAPVFQEQDIDGQALLLLTLPTVQECMELKLGPAIKLCHQIERVKVAFYRQYAD